MKKLIALITVACLASVAGLTLWGESVAPDAHRTLNDLLDRFDSFVLEQHTLKRYREAQDK